MADKTTGSVHHCYWNRLEEFITDHSEAEFSHGICPCCLEERYPGFDDGIIETGTR